MYVIHSQFLILFTNNLYLFHPKTDIEDGSLSTYILNYNCFDNYRYRTQSIPVYFLSSTPSTLNYPLSMNRGIILILQSILTTHFTQFYSQRKKLKQLKKNIIIVSVPQSFRPRQNFQAFLGMPCTHAHVHCKQV